MKFASKLSDNFLTHYKEEIPPWGPVGYVTYKRTYARMTPEGVTEEWWQTVARACNGLLEIGGAFEQSQIEKLFHYVFNLKCNFSGRALWQLGTDTVKRLGGDSLQNCWHVAINEPVDPFTFTFNELMLGGGVGFNIMPENVYELPIVKHSVRIERVEDNDCDYIVTDNREGWVELLDRVLRAFFFTGRGIRYNTSAIRARGKPIKSFGGTASGSEDLVKGIAQIAQILNQAVGRKLRPVECLDILNIIGSIVVAGNVRRSAQIACGDPRDIDYLNAKNWSRFVLPSWRQMSNNSVITSNVTDLPSNFWDGYEGKGEPYGLVNLPLCRSRGRLIDGNYRPDPDVVGVNPCVSADTWIHTTDGPKQVLNLIGQPFTAFVNGSKYQSSEEGFFLTGFKPIYEVSLANGLKVRTTEDHQYEEVQLTVKSRYLKWKGLDEIGIGGQVSLHNHRGTRWSGRGTRNLGWLIGSYLGDGTTTGNRAKLEYWTTDGTAEYATSMLQRELQVRSDAKHTTVALKDAAVEYGVTSDKQLASSIEETSFNFHCGFLSGWFDADGSVQGDTIKGQSIRLDSSILSNLEIAQRMLLRLGINSTIYKERREAGPRLIKGQSCYCEAQHTLAIANDNIQEFAKLIGFIEVAKAERLEEIIKQYRRKPNRERFTETIVSIDLVGTEAVYDCTIPGANQFDGNGINLHNCGEITLASYEACNLAELYLPNLATPEEFRDAAELMYMGIKTISMLPFINPRTTAIVEKNRRLGIGVTGFCAAPHMQDGAIYDGVYDFLEEKDRDYSRLIRSNESIKLTTVKPSGTNSLLPGVPPGVHPEYAPFYKRRITFAANDPIVAIAQAKGYYVEPKINIDGSRDYNTMIVAFPVKARKGSIVADSLTAIDQLENQKFLQTHWSDNSVSMTCYYKPEELDGIHDWLNENYESNVKTASFLLHSGHGFVQAPYEPISEGEYNELQSTCRPITSVVDHQALSLIDNLECSGGNCPIK